MRVNRADIEIKWGARAFAAAAAWLTNTSSTATDWAGPTAAAQDLWHAGVVAAYAAGKFAAGVEATGNAGFRARILEVTSTAYSTRVNTVDARRRYLDAMTPFLNALEALDLPPRTGDLMTDITQRVGGVCEEMQRVAAL